MTPQEAWKQNDDPSAPREISIREMTAEDQIRGMGIEDSFTVDSVLVLSFSKNQFSYTVKDIPSYEKRYTEDHTGIMLETQSNNVRACRFMRTAGL